MAPLIKDGAATLEQALDFARRREFEKACDRFLDASKKFANEGSIPGSNRARAYAELFSPGVRRLETTALVNLSNYLTSTLGNDELHPGPRSIAASELANQLRLTARDSNLMTAVQSGGGDPGSLAQALQGLANDYRQLGDQVLFLPELFEGRSVTAASRVPPLMAVSFETLGTAKQSTDPLAAAEHFQTAQQYWLQAGNEARGSAAASRVGSLAFQAKCWFCGREGTGHGIQFISMPVNQDLNGLKGADASPLPSVDQSGRLVFACKGCYSAVFGLADRIALQRAGETEMRLSARISALEARLQLRVG